MILRAETVRDPTIPRSSAPGVSAPGVLRAASTRPSSAPGQPKRAAEDSLQPRELPSAVPNSNNNLNTIETSMINAALSSLGGSSEVQNALLSLGSYEIVYKIQSNQGAGADDVIVQGGGRRAVTTAW